MSVNGSNTAVVDRFVDLAFVKNDLDGASKLLADGYQNHDPSRPGGLVVGIEGWKKSQEMYIKAIPNRRWVIQRQFQDADFVITRWVIEGTQTGDLPGIPATNREFKVDGIVITRVENEKIAEQWQVWDTQGFLEQLRVEESPVFKAG